MDKEYLESGRSLEKRSKQLQAVYFQYRQARVLLAEDNNGANGYLVLPILSVLFSVATQWLSMRQQKQSGQMNEAMGGGTMKTMMFIMPVMIGFFSLSYTAAFSLYLIISYAFSLALQLSSNAILLVIDKAEEKKVTMADPILTTSTIKTTKIKNKTRKEAEL